MIINTARSRKTGTAYQLAKTHVADKTVRGERNAAAEEEKTAASGEEKAESEAAAAGGETSGGEDRKTDVFLSSIKKENEQEKGLFSALSSIQSAKDSGGFQMRASAPEDSVGQLAAMLARAETKLDVLQVSGKATRALVNLKASAATAKGDEAKKLAAQIKRMEKLLKRIEKKLKHLDKEENLERERKRAVEKAEKQKAEQIETELRTRKKKRRRDEKNYADKELAEDEKEASSLDSLSGMDAVSGGDISASVPDAASLDVTV